MRWGFIVWDAGNWARVTTQSDPCRLTCA
jgi:hypothetical protein